MTEILATAKAVRRLSIAIGTDDYVRHCSNAQILPTTPVQTFKGGNPEAHLHDVAAASHMLALTLVHDYQNPDSLYRFLLEHAGEKAEFTLKPDRDGEFAATVEAVIIAPPIGNQVDQFGTTTLQMPCSKPVYGDPVAVIPAITGLTPDTALAAGGQLITITGTGFTAVSGITIDGETVEDYIVVNSRTIHAVVPTATAGEALVIVTNSAGASPAAVLTLTAD